MVGSHFISFTHMKQTYDFLNSAWFKYLQIQQFYSTNYTLTFKKKRFW